MSASSLPSSTRLLFDELLLRPNLRLRIGDHVVDVGALRLLNRPGLPRLTSKAVAVLIELVRNAGTTVTRDQLLDRVWADRVTTPDVLTQAIKELRRAFGDDAKPSTYIETIPRVGYRLLAPVGVVGNEISLIAEGASLAQADNDPETDAVSPEIPLLAPADIQPDLPPSKPWRWLLLGVLLLILLVAVALLRPSSNEVRSSEWTAGDIRVVTSDPGVERRPAVSPDGTRVVYSQLEAASGVDRIFVRVIGHSESALLTSKATTSEEMPMWSPDGTQIAFERIDSDRCTMSIASIVGGAEREVGACRDFVINYFDWTPDGKSLITSDNFDGNDGSMTLMRWDLETGSKQPLQYERTRDDQDLEAHYSPDGKQIAFRRGLAPYSDLYVMAASGGKVRQLTNLSARIRGLAWTADGAALVFSSDHEGSALLYTAALGDGRIAPVNVGPAIYPAAARAAPTVVYEIPRSVNRLAQIALGSEQTSPDFLAKSTGNDASPALSHDGKRLAFVSNRNGSQQVWINDLASGSTTPLSEFHDAVLINPAWSEDGSRVLVTVRQPENSRLVEIDPATRHERVITQTDERVLSGDYGPDPDSFLLVLSTPREHNELMLLEHAMTAQRHETVLAHSVEHVQLDKVARRIYFTMNAKPGLFVRGLDSGDEKLVTKSFPASIGDGWKLVDGRIWHVSRLAWNPTDIIEFDPATNASRAVGHLNAELRDARFSVDVARDRLFIVPLGLEDTDVGSFRLSRSASEHDAAAP